MRKGEILGLKWSNVDLPIVIITVEGTKSGHIRKIPITPQLTEILERARENLKANMFLSRWKGSHIKVLGSAWDHALKKAGIEDLTFHSLRHTFGTRLGMIGADLGTIQELMGHADLKMTKRYYHPTSAHKREAVEALDRVTAISTTWQLEHGKQKNCKFWKSDSCPCSSGG